MNTVAIDLGGTKIAAARVDRAGNILARAQCATPGQEGREAILDAVAALAAELKDAQSEGIGIGSAGVIHADGRVLRANDTLKGWQGADIVGGLRARTGFAHIRAVNDVNAHARGEAWLGAAKGVQSVFVMALGTGIGGCWLNGGVPHTGENYVTGHYGDVYVPHELGGAHQLEAVASGTGIFHHYQQHGGNPDIKDTRGVFAAYAHDAVAQKVLHAAADAVGTALASIAHVIDPQMIVYGGGLAEVDDWWWARIRDTYRARALLPLQNTPIVKATLGTDAALIGAASLIWEGGHAA